MKVDFTKLDRAFNPRCVVVVGASRQNDYQWLNSQLTFKGKLYSVQVNPQSIEHIKAMGVENYTSLLDVPEPIDLVIIAVPRAIVPQVLDDCIRKDVAAIHMFTAGFSETETEEGIRAEEELKPKRKQPICISSVPIAWGFITLWLVSDRFLTAGRGIRSDWGDFTKRRSCQRIQFGCVMHRD